MCNIHRRSRRGLRRANKRIDKDQFKILGRILTHMAMLTKTVPIKIAKTVYAILADREPHKKDILNDFLLHCTLEERRVISLGLANYAALSKSDTEYLQSIFIANDLHQIPKMTDFKEQVYIIAEDVILAKTKDFIMNMRDGLPLDLLMTVWRPLTRKSLLRLLEKEAPTVEKIVAAIETEVNYTLSNKEERILHYLKSLVYSLKNNKDMLMKFTVFVTGSSNMPKTIKLIFNHLSSSVRRPIVHTCSNIIELSTSYSSYQEFRKELIQYLSNEYAFQYTQI